MLKKLIYIVPVSLILLQGCSALIDGHTVAVDSYAAKPVVVGTYYLSTENVSVDLDIEKQTFENSIQEMLTSKGYNRTFVINNANYNIVYDYKVSGPFTTEEDFPAPINEWWGIGGPYGGVYNGLYDANWYGDNVQYVNYFVKELSLTAYSNDNPVWQVKGHTQSQTPNLNEDYQYLVSGVANYIDVSSGKVIYINVVKDSKTGKYTATKL
ncbi:hypothetical protein [Cetobacterium sp. 2G large]|uniref:hypothetical protein n=1 Tax=Cetobacterium sp. 2G large TaxID=2759680 RepID=UPI00163B8EBE|nr:hypothetical protein [Cetobacterium sp. 2G large]MBC2854869.1 hypothetical protein [Cetobacterium sp. 2G large]